MVVRLRHGIALAQVREQPLSAPFTAERSLMRHFPHQPLRGYRVRGAFASFATPQTPFCIQTLSFGFCYHEAGARSFPAEIGSKHGRNAGY